MYEEAKKTLKAFQDHTIFLVKRDSNRCDDALAKHARSSGVSFLVKRELVTEHNFSGFPSYCKRSFTQKKSKLSISMLM
jgi:hypothetical protein